MQYYLIAFENELNNDSKIIEENKIFIQKNQ